MLVLGQWVCISFAHCACNYCTREFRFILCIDINVVCTFFNGIMWKCAQSQFVHYVFNSQSCCSSSQICHVTSWTECSGIVEIIIIIMLVARSNMCIVVSWEILDIKMVFKWWVSVRVTCAESDISRPVGWHRCLRRITCPMRMWLYLWRACCP